MAKVLTSTDTVVVTGGAGFVGSHVVDRLCKTDVGSIVVVDNLFLGTLQNLEAAKSAGPVTLAQVDMADGMAFGSLVRSLQPTTIFDLATVPLPTSLEYPSMTVAANVGMAIAASEAVRSDDAGRLVHVSSSEVFGTAVETPMTESHPRRPSTPYAASKSAADDIIMSYVSSFGIDASIVRPFNNYGPRQNSSAYAGAIPTFANRIASDLPIEIHGDGRQTRDFVYVEETAEAIVKADELELAPGVDVNLGTGTETTVLQLADMVRSVLERPDHPIVHVARRPGDVDRHCGSSRKAAELLGVSPRAINLDDLARTLA